MTGSGNSTSALLSFRSPLQGLRQTTSLGSRIYDWRTNLLLLKRAIPLFLVFIATPLLSAEPIVFPAEGQTPEQQKQDEGDCHVWAVDNTGVNPAALASKTAEQQSEIAQQASQPAPAPERRRGGALKGAAAGAVVGEIVDDDAGKGAAYGAAAGVVSQRRRNRKAEQQVSQQQQQMQQEAAQQQQALAANQQEQLDTYYRAYSACLTGKGYTVN